MNNIFCCESESVSAKKKREIMRELVRGQEAATQLMILLQKPFGSEGSLSSEKLMANVLTSFTQALSIINSSSEPGSADEVTHRNLLISGENGSLVAGSANDPTSGVCREKRPQKGGRGRYNRRKSTVAWTILSCTIDDNHAWRKYGQKGILNSEFPRSYYRCSHKYDQGCKATKQVQLDQENPNMYQTTYIGLHTCNATPMSTHSAIGYSSTAWESYVLNFESDYNVSNVQDHHITSPSLTIKQALPKESHTSSDVTHDRKFLDPSMWSDLKDFESSKPTIVPLKMESDNNADKVYSGTDSQHLDIDFGVSLHFGTDSFHLDQSQLL